MAAIHITRVDRLVRLERALPGSWVASDACPDGQRLLAILGDAYGSANEKARRRALQRDLSELVSVGRIAVINPGGKPLRYRRLDEDPADEHPLIDQYRLQQIRDVIAETLPSRRFDRLWQRLITELGTPLLDEKRVRVVPDTLRLQPVDVYPGVLSAVIESLAYQWRLRVLYEDAKRVRGEAILHPQALLQRGPIPYLFALKNDEESPTRLYALHRMIRAEVIAGQPARSAPAFDIEQEIASGRADFGKGQLIDLELRVRGYLSWVITVCPLAADQRIADEPPGSDFELRVSARVPSTGQLLRWLLGAGQNVEVVAPADMRHVMAVQAAKMMGIYGDAECRSWASRDAAASRSCIAQDEAGEGGGVDGGGELGE